MTNDFQSDVDRQLDRVRTFTDSRLMNTIDQAHNFPAATVEAAHIVALEKGLVSKYDSSESSSSMDTSHLFDEAKRLLKKNIPVTAIYNKLMETHTDESTVLKALHSAAVVVDFSKVGNKKEQSNSWVWFVVIIVILNLVRVLLR